MDENKAMMERMDACIQFMGEVKEYLALQTNAVATPAPVAKKAEKVADPVKEEVPSEVEDELDTEVVMRELMETEESELIEILTAYGLKVPRRSAKRDYKQSIAEAVLDGIQKGVIELAEEDESAEPDESNGQEAEDGGEETPAEDNNEDSEDGDESGDEQDGEPADPADIELPEEALAYREELERMIEEGEIKPSQMKKFLSAHFADDEECKECKGCSKEDTYNCFMDNILGALIDDDGDFHSLSDPYIKNEEVYCCGLKCDEKNENYTCVGHCRATFGLE